MHDTKPEGWEDNKETNIRTVFWTDGTRQGLQYQDMDSKDAWLAMKDGLDLRKWA